MRKTGKREGGTKEFDTDPGRPGKYPGGAQKASVYLPNEIFLVSAAWPSLSSFICSMFERLYGNDYREMIAKIRLKAEAEARETGGF